MRIVAADPKMLKYALDTIGDFVTEGTFKVSSDGMELIAMDPANVAMIILRLLPTAFIEWDVNGEEFITVNIDNLSKILKRAKARDQVTLMTDSENRLNVILEGGAKRIFRIPLIEGEEETKKKPNLEFSNRIEIEASTVEEAVKDAKLIADSIVFEANKDKFLMYAKGDSSEVKVELTKDSPSIISLEVEEDAKARYSIDYLEKMVKVSKVSDTVTIRFKTNYPLQLDFKALDKMQVTFILAPRVEQE